MSVLCIIGGLLDCAGCAGRMSWNVMFLGSDFLHNGGSGCKAVEYLNFQFF